VSKLPIDFIPFDLKLMFKHCVRIPLQRSNTVKMNVFKNLFKEVWPSSSALLKPGTSRPLSTN